MMLKSYAVSQKRMVQSHNAKPVEAFANILDEAWGLFDQSIDDFMWATTNVILGVDPAKSSLWARQIHAEGGDRMPALRNSGLLYNPNDNPFYAGLNLLPYGSVGDWKASFYDGTDNQAFHFYYYTALSYYDGYITSRLAVALHDPVHPLTPRIPLIASGGVSPADNDLGVAGANMSIMLRVIGSLPPIMPNTKFLSPGQWVMENLAQ